MDHGTKRRNLGRGVPFIVGTIAMMVAAIALIGQSAIADAGPGQTPFATEASARVDATVTRVVGSARVTLPAAVVPALSAGDVINVTYPDYTRPPASVNYHTNVAFITEVAPQHWLLERSSPADRLFSPPQKRHARAVAPAQLPGLHFTYGSNDAHGIPIFVIVPEDGATRGMDGVRDYLNAHPTDFKNMAESADDALDRYVWFSDFLQSISQGSIDPISGRQRVESVAASLGVNPATIDGCYTPGATRAAVADCIQTSLNAVSYQTNIEAPTQAQFFGGVFGAAAPVQIASYLVPLLSVWRLFIHTGHKEYEYLPTTLRLNSHTSTPSVSDERLTGLKVPTLRPPAAISDVLFFTIGDPQAAADPPSIVNASNVRGLCAAEPRVALPVHLDRTSAYVHDTRLVIKPDGASPYSIAILPGSAAAPALDISQLAGAADGAYAVSLAGAFGFDALREPEPAAARVVVPRRASWSIMPLPHQPPIAGESFDAVASSSAAPCLSRAEIQVGSAPPVALEIKALSDRRVSLHASLQNIPPGIAHVRFYQTDTIHDADIEDDVAIPIAAAPAHIDAKSPPTIALGDPFIELAGAAFETVSGLRVNGTLYGKDAGSQATLACFSGPPVQSLLAGEQLSAQLVESDGSPGQVFVAQVQPPRPALATLAIDPDTPIHLATDPLSVTLTMATGNVPSRYAIDLRRARPNATPCDAVRGDDAAYAVLPPSATSLRSATSVRVDLLASQVLGDAAFGPLQIALVDTTSKAQSAWQTLPGTFVRAPRVTSIACGAAGTSCRLLGSGLEWIASLDGPNGTTVQPGHDCTPPHGLQCLVVPPLAHYVLHLVDGGPPVALPDSLISAPAQAPTPAPVASP